MYNRCIYSVEVVHAKLSLYVLPYFNRYNDSNDLCLVIRTDFKCQNFLLYSFNHFIYWVSNLTRLADIGKAPGYKETRHFC